MSRKRITALGSAFLATLAVAGPEALILVLALVGGPALVWFLVGLMY